MKEPEYVEGPKALKNFERGIKALFKVPKADILQRENRAKRKAVNARKSKRSDKD